MTAVNYDPYLNVSFGAATSSAWSNHDRSKGGSQHREAAGG